MVLLPRVAADGVGLLLIDIQEKLFGKIYDHDRLLTKIQILVAAVKLLHIPILLTEQYPQGLGSTVKGLSDQHIRLEKTAFSCAADPQIKNEIMSLPVRTWILAGIETHICVLQTARDLLDQKKEVIIPQDATSSRHLLDRQSALDELRLMQARVTTVETLLFDLLVDAKHPQFKAISQLIK